MFSLLYCHINGAGTDIATCSIERMFSNNVRFQVLCRNQEEKDYLQALCLVYGRELKVDTREEWENRPAKPYMSFGEPGAKISYLQEALLPIVYTTFHVNLRGH